MEDIKWTTAELIAAYKDTEHDLDLLRSAIRNRGISWQTLACNGIKSLAAVKYIRDKDHRVSFSEARSVVESYVLAQKKDAIQRLCQILRQTSK